MEIHETQGVYLSLVNFENLFSMLGSEAVIVNDFDLGSAEDQERLNDMLITRYDGDTLDVLPSCDCGQYRGERNVNVRCPQCNTLVLPVTEKPLESTLWVRVPEGVHSFFNPTAWTILSKHCTTSGFNALEHLCNPTYPKKAPAHIAKRMERFEYTRSLNWVVENFDHVFERLHSLKILKSKGAVAESLFTWIRENRESIFTRYIPIPSKLTFIVENTATGAYADTSMRDIVDAIRTITSIETAAIPPTPRVREIRSVKAVTQLSAYYTRFIKDSAGGKYGWFRKHVFGSRLHFTFRAVISSLSDNHTYDELHLPWSMSVMAFKAHLTSKLMKRGFSPNKASQFLYENTLKYNSLLDEMFNELISEAPEQSIKILFSRNPTLQRGSVQLMRITRIKPDPKDNTISMGVLVLKALPGPTDRNVGRITF